jgi:hypothetical protein
VAQLQVRGSSAPAAEPWPLGDFVNDRHQVLADKEFWLALEFSLSGWFRTCADRSLGGFWCDGFLPHSANDTKHGVDVYGNAWIVDGRKVQREYAFVVSIPQRMLSRRRNDIRLTGVDIDVAHERLQFAVAPAGGSAEG